MKKYLVSLFLPIVCVFLFITSCSSTGKGISSEIDVQTDIPDESVEEIVNAKADAYKASSGPVKQEESVDETPHIVTASFTAVGDNLIHENIYRQANERALGLTYNFAPAYENIIPFIYFSDFAFVNQETLILPQNYKPSTYPSFATPSQMGDYLVSAGFNMFSMANNHMLDKGEEGLKDSINWWKSKQEQNPEIIVTGAFSDENDRLNLRVIERNGIKLSLIAFTTTLNGLKLPPKTNLRILQSTDEDYLELLIKKAREQSDMVIVSAHWGEEYESSPNETQKEMARKLADWGADIIIGTHPHVLQPLEEITAEDGRKVLVAYSLGNFISAQSEGNRLIGGMLTLKFEKDLDTGVTSYNDVALVPLVTQYEKGFRDISVYPLGLYTPEQARTHGVRKYTSSFNYNYILNNVKKIVDSQYLKLPEAVLSQNTKRYVIWLMR